jgi:hypothetical protein
VAGAGHAPELEPIRLVRDPLRQRLVMGVVAVADEHDPRLVELVEAFDGRSPAALPEPVRSSSRLSPTMVATRRSVAGGRPPGTWCGFASHARANASAPRRAAAVKALMR